MCRAIRSAAEHVGGYFGGGSEEYEKAYLPWDEMVQALISENVDKYAPSELVLETEWSDG